MNLENVSERSRTKKDKSYIISRVCIFFFLSSSQRKREVNARAPGCDNGEMLLKQDKRQL